MGNEQEFNDVINYALLNNIVEIIFQERNSGSKILMRKLGDSSLYTYNDFYEKGYLLKIFKAIHEKYNVENFDENILHCQRNSISFNDFKLEYIFVKMYPSGFDVNFKLI